MKINQMFKKVMKFIFNKDYRFLILSTTGIYNNLDDEEYLKRKYKGTFDKELNLEKPKLYSEKLQWLKLYDRKPEYTNMVDKYEVKKIVSEKIGKKYVIPTYGIWDNWEEIDFSKLPNQFVLKCTHDSGGLIICKDKEKLNLKKAKKKINKCLNKNFFYQGREWPYKNVKPRIIAEKYIESEVGDLHDYKFFCFNGEPKLMFIASDRQNHNEETKFDFFDMKFNNLNIINGHPCSKNLPEKPRNFERMKELSRILSNGIPQLRVDFYEVNSQVIFGEVTFFHHSGFCRFEPETWDEKIGNMLILPKKK